MADAILVTAGNKRIGKVIVKTLSQAGYFIYLHHHNSEYEARETLEEIGGNGEVVQCNLGDYGDVERLITKIVSGKNPLKHIVNNASLFSVDEATNFTETSFTDHMNINLRGPLQLARALHQALDEDERGSVVNILDSKVFSLNSEFFSYSLSKFGLFGATEMLAQALSPKVRVNGIAPGLTLISETQTPENFELASHLNFVGAPLNVDDIASSVLHLISATSINGAVLPVDGGQKLMNFTKDVVNVATGLLEKNK